MKHNRVGLGTFPLTGVFNEIKPHDAEKVVRAFLDDGGYYIDVAPLYGNGEIEKLVGKVVKSYPRDSFYIITKTVKNVNKDGKLFKSGKYKDVVEQIDNSLDRLGLEYVDQLMVHSPDQEVLIEETLSALEDVQKAGKAKDLSVSNVNLNELREFNKSRKIKYVQNNFSFINRSIDSEFKDYLIKNDIGLIPYHVLEIGLLSDIALNTFTLRAGDLREKVTYWNKENQEEVFKFVKERLKPIAEELRITIGQLSQAWALSQDFIKLIIVGTTKINFLKNNLEANEIKLSQNILKRLENEYLSFENRIKVKYGKSLKDFRGLNEKFY